MHNPSAPNSSVTSFIHAAMSGDPTALDKAMATGSNATDLHSSGLQGMIHSATTSSSGTSFLDPTYLAISLTLSAIASGMLIWGKKSGQLRYVFWSFSLFALSYDYTSGPVWAVAILFGVFGRFVE